MIQSAETVKSKVEQLIDETSRQSILEFTKYCSRSLAIIRPKLCDDREFLQLVRVIGQIRNVVEPVGNERI